jgi:hypothetical protein
MNVVLDLPPDLIATLEARIVERLRRTQIDPEPWPEFLSDRTASKYADVAPSTVARWRKSGLRSCIVNGVVRVRRGDLDTWMERNATRR